MRVKLILIFILISIQQVFAFRNWQSFTNTTHIYNGSTYNNSIFFGTWGGVLEFDPASGSFVKTIRITEGVSDIDVIGIKEIPILGQTAFATRNMGVDFYNESGFQIPLRTDTGLLSNKVTAINTIGNLLLIGTENGLSVFENNTSFPYPLLIDNYTSSDGLPQNRINDINVNTDNGYIFITADSGFVFVHKDSLDYYSSWHETLSDKKSIKVSISSQIGAVTTTKGLYRFNMSDLFHPENWVRFLQTDSLYACYIDNNNNIYASFGYWDRVNQIFVKNVTRSMVIIKPDNTMEPVFYTDADTPQETLTAFIPFNNKLYISSWGKGIYQMFYDSSTLSFINYNPNCLNSNTVTRITADNNSKVWVCDGYEGATPTIKGTKGISGFNGDEWISYNVENSDLISDNINCLETDSQNRKWFGCWAASYPGWSSGISILDDSDPDHPVWKRIQSTLYNNTIARIKMAPDNKMWVASYTGGVNVLNTNDQVIHQFKIPSVSLNDYYNFYFTPEKTFIGTKLTGLHWWDYDSLPETNGSYWTRPDIPDIRSGRIYDIAVFENDYTHQVWVSSSGLYMGETINNETTWYKYESQVKRKVYSNGEWVNDTYYYSDEERMFGAINSNISAIELDPFGRLWIGSESEGFAVYDIENDRFTNFKISGYPLLSNFITDFAYSPKDGIMYIGTNKGLNAVEIGTKDKEEITDLGDIVAFPNPFYPNKSSVITFRNKGGKTMPAGETSCKIFDLNGQLVVDLGENRFHEFEWDGKNKKGKDCASGLYFYLIKTDKGSRKGKIVIIR